MTNSESRRARAAWRRYLKTIDAVAQEIFARTYGMPFARVEDEEVAQEVFQQIIDDVVKEAQSG